jgi:DNA-directed RNA polymerase specialized sigma24 family protein
MATEQRALLRLAAALSGDAATADDIVADVLGRAYEQWDRIAGLERVEAYVRRMVVNEFHAERDALKSRIAQLPERQRAVLRAEPVYLAARTRTT